MSALRIAHPGEPTRLVDLVADREVGLTQRQRDLLRMVRAFGGNRSRAARALGVSVQTVQWAMREAARLGAAVPPAPRGGSGRGPDLQPRKRRTA